MRFVDSILITNSIHDYDCKVHCPGVFWPDIQEKVFGCSVKTIVLKRISKLEASRALSFLESCDVL